MKDDTTHKIIDVFHDRDLLKGVKHTGEEAVEVGKLVSQSIEEERKKLIEILQGQRDLIAPNIDKEYVRGIDWCISILLNEIKPNKEGK